MGIGDVSPPGVGLVVKGTDSQQTLGGNTKSAIRITNGYGSTLGRRSELQFALGDNNALLAVIAAEYTSFDGSVAGDLIFGTTPNNSSTMYERMRINRDGLVGIATSLPDASLEITTKTNSPGIFTVNKWSNSHNDGYLLELQTIWGTHGINHVFVQKFSNVEYNSLSFFKGRVGVGTTEPDGLFTVNGTIHSKEVKVDLNVPAPDYVFQPDYDLISLNKVKEYIDKNSHLPEIPSAAKMEKEGIDVGEMNMLLLKKIEELTLYMLDFKSEILTRRKYSIEGKN